MLLSEGMVGALKADWLLEEPELFLDLFHDFRVGKFSTQILPFLN